MLFFQELLILCCEILNLILLSNIIDHLWLIHVLINKYYIIIKKNRVIMTNNPAFAYISLLSYAQIINICGNSSDK